MLLVGVTIGYRIMFLTAATVNYKRCPGVLLLRIPSRGGAFDGLFRHNVAGLAGPKGIVLAYSVVK
jgi:hypothetical protein